MNFVLTLALAATVTAFSASNAAVAAPVEIPLLSCVPKDDALPAIRLVRQVGCFPPIPGEGPRCGDSILLSSFRKSAGKWVADDSAFGLPDQVVMNPAKGFFSFVYVTRDEQGNELEHLAVSKNGNVSLVDMQLQDAKLSTNGLAPYDCQFL